MPKVDDVLKDVVESFYRQKRLPSTAVVFKMKMAAAIEYLKSKGHELPHYDKHVEAYKARTKGV